MSTDLTVTPAHAYPSETPPTPPIPTQMRALAHRMLELDDEQQLRELLDSSLPHDCNIHHLYGAMVGAIQLNKVYLVVELLRRGLPISPLDVLEAVKAKAKEVLTIFFNNGWDINKPMGAMSPPALADAHEDPEMTAWLLSKGADPNARCDIDYTPLSHAVQYADREIIDLLLRHGGDIRKGQLVHHAVYRDVDAAKVVEDLVERGAPLDALMYEGDQASMFMFFFMRETPLYTAVALKKRDVIRYLIRKGADVNSKNYRGQTVIQHADEDTRREIIQEVQKRSMLHASL